jgi:hypothetical protein
MNGELRRLFREDQREHALGLEAGTPEYDAMRERDRRRRHRAWQVIGTLIEPAPEDLYHTAWLLNHGDEPEEAQCAHELALKAARLGYAPACWLAAAAYDRWCMYRGLPQTYGTQFVPDGARYRLWDMDSVTSDEERARWNVPPLRQQQRRADELSRTTPQPPMDRAPAWLKQALQRWQRESNS